MFSSVIAIQMAIHNITFCSVIIIMIALFRAKNVYDNENHCYVATQ